MVREGGTGRLGGRGDSLASPDDWTPPELSPDAEVPGEQVLLDGNWDFVGGGNTRTIVKGDASCLSIAAASIVAKVTRDRYMQRADALHPGWEFAAHVGYSTPEHRAAIERQGVSPLHRMSFQSMAYQQLAL